MIVAALSPTLGPLLVAAVVLFDAGAAKLARPAPTAIALARLGWSAPDAAVRCLGVVEIAVAVAAAAWGGPAAVAMAALYVGFAGVSALQIRTARASGEAADCGCFGDRSAPVGRLHVVVNLLLAAGAAVAAAGVGLVGALEESAGSAVLVAVLALVGAAGVRGLLTDLPAAVAAGTGADRTVAAGTRGPARVRTTATPGDVR